MTASQTTIRRAGLAGVSGAIAVTSIAVLFQGSSARDDWSEILTPGALASEVTQPNLQAFCQWYRQLPELARVNLQADAELSGMPTGAHALDYYISTGRYEPK
ncbi:MAG: hypothetical protein B7Y80_17045 [Hyphomicrobium sp. 32-62-53]|nr:MAG: hypothetical protein B7Y80_17045 [Hyphomicrobium sp. 32-62-53]